MSKKSNALRDDNRIKVQVYLGRDPETQKRKYKYVYGKTQKEADAKADAVRAALGKGIDVTPELVTFSQWADKWLLMKAAEVSNSTYLMYKGCSKHLEAAFGGTDITKVRPADVQGVLIKLSQKNPNTGRPAAKQTLRDIKASAVQVFQLAIDNRVMDYNPARTAKITAKEEPGTRRALTETEQRWIEDTPHRAKLAAMIMMYSGLRRGELIALTWNDIDLHNGTITVNKAVEMIEGKPLLKGQTKTVAGMRTINIPNRLIDFLKIQPRESIYVCVNVQGKLHTKSSWRRMWESYLAELNVKHGDFSSYSRQPKSRFDPGGAPFVIPKITPHWLRHTFCTMLYFAGVDILTAKNQMGHADIKTTMQIYTHLDAIHKRKEIGKLNEYLESAGHVQVKQNG